VSQWFDERHVERYMTRAEALSRAYAEPLLDFTAGPSSADEQVKEPHG